MRQVGTARECVLRAMAASEIADACPDPRQRASILAQAEVWLARAQRAAAAKRPARVIVH